MRKLRFRVEACAAQGQPTPNRYLVKWGGWKSHLDKFFTSHQCSAEMLSGPGLYLCGKICGARRPSWTMPKEVLMICLLGIFEAFILERAKVFML